MEILIMITTSIIFFVGILIGYKLKNNENIIPNIESIKEKIPVTREYKEKKEEIRQQELIDEEIEKINTIAQNIEAFDGTSRGQRSV